MQNFVKNLTYPPKEAARDKSFVQLLLRKATIDPGTYSRIGNLILQALHGAQLWVSKDVSDDLLASDLDPSEICFNDVTWPEPRLEVFFEDPTIPTFLAARSTDLEQHQALERAMGRRIEVDERARRAFEQGDVFISVQTEDRESSMLSVTYRPEDIDKFARGEALELKMPDSPVATSMNAEEAEAVKDLTILLFKVLLLASSDGHEVRRTRERPTKRQGGKPGFRNRPVTDRLIVEYLPRHLEERRRAAESDGGKHAFHGRRGHWRRFRAERFVNLKGTKKFIYPVPGPDGSLPRKKFVVKKILAST